MRFKTGLTNNSVSLGRRRALILLGAGTVAPMIGGQVRANTAKAPPQLLSDGQLELTLGFILPETPAEALQAQFGTSDPNTPFAMPCTVPLLIDGDRMILFDAGAGPYFMDSAGTLLDSLQEAGVKADQITDIVFTHCHPDHLWGVTDDFDDLTFPNATCHLRQEEYDFWNNPDAANQMPEESRAFAAGASARLPRIADQMELFSDGAEVLPGVEAMATPGHTPGHTSFVLHLDGDPLMLTGDVLSHPATIAHPDWRWGTDQDRDMAAETRRRMVDRLVADRMRVVTYHMDPPGIGRIEVKGGKTSWVAE